jgi:ABC-type glycerol-3-phosphate transport system substrate-binding protein
MSDLPVGLTRRAFLKRLGVLGAALPAANIIAACSPAAVTTKAPAVATQAPAVATKVPAATATPAKTTELTFWWWGEQEAPGLKGWLGDTVAKFTEQSDTVAKVETVLQATDNVISDFTTAAAAGKPPDLQYMWNGIYHMENVWLGYIEALNGLIPADELKHHYASPLSFFEGKQYRSGWYLLPVHWVYNKEILASAGVKEAPRTWEEFVAACETVKKSGVTPIAVGNKDGFWSEWYFGQGLGQQLDSPADALKLMTGELDFRNSRYHEHWVKLEELWDKGYINEDANSLELYQGIDGLFNQGKAAFCQIVGPLVPDAQEKLGAENVGAIPMPKFGIGKYAGLPVVDVQGVGIAASSEHKQAAADFIVFMHSEERRQALWDDVKQMPADDRWDGDTIIQDPTLKKMWGWFKGDNSPYFSDIIPTLFWTDAMFVAGQKIIAGEMAGKEAGDLAAEVAAKWRDQNPDMLANYKRWASSIGTGV